VEAPESPRPALGEQLDEIRSTEVMSSVERGAVEAPVPVQPRVKQGNAAWVFIEKSPDADLLVAGNRGRGGFPGLVLGSVSQHVAAYAKCPVTVVR
jgi:nucleotide-binding universal stress UspA family protein